MHVMLVFLTFSFTYTSRQDYPEVEISVKAVFTSEVNAYCNKNCFVFRKFCYYD